MKSSLKSYLFGFFNGFGCTFSFWEKPEFKDIMEDSKKPINERIRELDNKAWYQTSLDFRQAYDSVAKKYGYKNE